MSKKNDVYIQIIREANERNQLAIFVGAGVSVNSGYPLWGEVIDVLKSDLHGEADKVSDYTKLAQMYKLKFGKTVFEKKVQNSFPVKPKNLVIQEEILKIKPHYIITTNQDVLLENANMDNLYDVIVDDSELVKSELPNKIIKMHGDFGHNNIVFSEDDYMNYSDNFPLIENFIKSIISTHVILFLGYSYNDSTLKQINLWFRKHSKNYLPMYIVIDVNIYTELESQYLREQRITTIKIGQKKKNADFKTPLKQLLEKISIDVFYPSNYYDIKLLFSKINGISKDLSQLNTVFYKQIIDSMSNIYFVYDANNMPYLQLAKTIATTDQNIYVRKMYKEISKILNNADKNSSEKKLIENIQFILYLARLKGLVYENEQNELAVVIENNETYYASPFLDFNFDSELENIDEIEKKLQELYKFSYMAKPKEALLLAEEIIELARQQRQYHWLFIAMYNYNVLIKKFVYYTPTSRHKIYNLEKIISDYPNKIRESLQSLLKFLNYDYIYQELFSTDLENQKVQKNRSIIERGGKVFISGGVSYPYKHSNTIDFVLNNYILMEEFSEYKELNKKYVKIAITQQFQEGKTVLSKYELFTCIKYFKPEDLELLFSEFVKTDGKSPRELFLQKNQFDYIIGIWDNLVKYHNIRNFDSFAQWHLLNCITLLSFVVLEEEQFKIIIDRLKDFISIYICDSNFFQAVNKFIGIRANTHNQLLDAQESIGIIDSLLEKIVHQRYNLHEYMAFSTNTIGNVYGTLSQTKVKYSNSNYIKNYIEILKRNDDESGQFQAAIGVLYTLLYVSNEEVCTVIKSYMKELAEISVDSESYLFEFKYTLLLILQDLEERNISNAEWEDLLNFYKTTSRFSSQTNAILQFCKSLREKAPSESKVYNTKIDEVIVIIAKILEIRQNYLFKSNI